MHVTVGTKNPIKINAVKSQLLKSLKQDFTLEGLNVDTGVDEQPRTLEETFAGAKNRACLAFTENSQLSFGLEDGLFAIPTEEKAFMNICCCVIYNGSEYFYGCSSAFEYPADIIEEVMENGLDVSQALNKCGYTKDPKIGSDIGAIGILSQGQLVRQQYSEQAVAAASIHLGAQASRL